MMKTALLILLLIPFISLGQLSKKDKKNIDKYALSMCGCLYDLFETLHPKTDDVIFMIAQNGQEEAMLTVETWLEEMDSDEMNEFLSSFQAMESPEFLQKIEECDDSDGLDPNIKEQVDNARGDAHIYLLKALGREDGCELMKALYDLGNSQEN